MPSSSIVAENPVTWVDSVVAKRKTAQAAQAYLEFLYTPAAQEIIARHHFRPTDPAVLTAQAGRFPKLTLFAVPDVFGSWAKAQSAHFADGGVFDQIYTSK